MLIFDGVQVSESETAALLDEGCDIAMDYLRPLSSFKYTVCILHDVC